MRTPRLPIVSTLALIAGIATAADVPVKRVVLFSSGVGYYEHAGTVDGSTTTDLSFKTGQINDVLKSLVVEDRDGGQITTVAYPSQDPLSKTLKSFQLDLSGSPTLGNLLAQLRGAEVSVVTADEKLTGTVLGVETQKRIVGDRGDSIEVVVLNLLSGASVRALPMDSVRSFDLVDARLRAELGKALAAIAQARDQDSKPVTIRFQGDGQRRVRLGYVVEAPVWKTSYRLVLGDGPDLSRLQGWAIVENQTDSDWTDIGLTLVSGRPISFIQDLYRPLYIQRPVFVPDLVASLGPVAYDGGITAPTTVAATRREGLAKARAAAPAPAGFAAAELQAAEAGGADAMMDMASNSVQSAATAEKLGEFFHYQVAQVTLERQRSAMLPIVTDPIRSERVSIYNASVQPKHPLLGAKVTNTTGKHLLGGPITVYDGGGYSGDARIEDLPPGQERLISFAVDLQVRVISEGRGTSTSILGGKIVKGVLMVQQKRLATQDYQIANKSDQARSLIIEHPLMHGWNLVDTPKPIETTESLHRFGHDLAAGAESTFTVKQEHVDWEHHALVNWDVGTLLNYQRTGTFPAKVREALAEAAKRKQAVVDIERGINEREQEVRGITQEQQRIRENMRTVQANTAYHQRLLAKLNDQETRIDELRAEQEKLRQDHQTQRAALETYLSGLNLE